MKKWLTPILFSCTLLPSVIIANSTDSLLPIKTEIGICGYPPASNPDFCHCFINQAIISCKLNGARHGIPPQLCTEQQILNGLKPVNNVKAFCSQHLDMMPSGIGILECAADIDYVKSNC